MGSFACTWRRQIDSRPSSLTGWAFFVALWPASLPFRLITFWREALYRSGVLKSYRATVPVISIGNLTVGGTGKTPVVDDLARRLLAKGVRVAVVSRGYGGRYRDEVGVVAVGDGRLLMSAHDAGDEPSLLARRNPALRVYVARKRALGVQAAERDGAQVIILDDGFQHLAVRRDLDIVLLDARAPFGNGQLLPAGPLREAPAALRRADLVILTHTDRVIAGAIPFPGPVLHCRPVLADRLRTLDGRDVTWPELAGKELLAFAGIARPDDFFAAVRARGVMLAEAVALNDHQQYPSEQLNRLIQSCDNQKFLITTEKDGVKLHSADVACPCVVVPMVLAFDESARLDALLARLLERVK